MSFNLVSDLISTFLLSNKKQHLIDVFINKITYISTVCQHEKDEHWNEMIKFVSNEIEINKIKNTQNFYKKFYPLIRGFFQSTIPQFSLSNTNHNSIEVPRRGGSYRKKAKFWFLTYNFTNNISLEKFLEQIFEIFSGRLLKYIAADDVAPTTGQLHKHIYLELVDFWDINDTGKTLAVRDSQDNLISPNVAESHGMKNHILYCAKKEKYLTNMDLDYELKAKKLDKQYSAYKLISGKETLTQVTREYPELLFWYNNLKGNLNSYLNDVKKENNPENKLIEWQMFGIQTWFSGNNKTPQYWIVGPKDVGKTENIRSLKNKGHRSYLMPKNKDWADWDDNNIDFVYSEETHADYSLTFLNQMLEGTEIKLEGKFVNNITKNKNVPFILNSNYMPHMVYKNTDLYSLTPTLSRMYIIYVDSKYNGHIIWNPNTMTTQDYADKFMNNNIDMESYDYLFENEFENESSTDKSYIKYIKTCDEHINVIPYQEITVDMLNKPRENVFYNNFPLETKDTYDIDTDNLSVSSISGYDTVDPESSSMAADRRRLKNKLKRNKKKLKKLKLRQLADEAVKGSFDEILNLPDEELVKLDVPGTGYFDELEDIDNFKTNEPEIVYFDELIEKYDDRPIDYTINCKDKNKIEELRYNEANWDDILKKKKLKFKDSKNKIVTNRSLFDERKKNK